MGSYGDVDVTVCRVFNNVAKSKRNSRGPVATPHANLNANRRVPVSVKGEVVVGPTCLCRQLHIDDAAVFGKRRIIDRCPHGPLVLFRDLLGHDDLPIKLLV